MFAHLIRQRAWQLDGEHHVGLGNFNPSSSHGLLHVPACLTDRHAVPTGHRASGGNGGHPRPDQIGGGVDPPGVLDAIDTITPNHVMNILPIMTPPTPWARKTLQPPVAERHLEAEVAHCVGGVASPLLMNVALHGMEVAAGVRYYDTGTNAGKTVPNCPVVVRYADDLIALCHSRAQAEQVKARLAEWLAPRGLGFNQAKTQITHLDQGVDFLGFNIRRHRGKLLTKPSNDALRRIRERLSAEAKALRGANADTVIAKLNPIIRGWSADYRIGVSKRAFAALDAHMWRLVYKWARFSHPNKPTRWVTAQYCGKFNPSSQDRWVFGSRETGFYLRKFAWTKIVRHRMVAGRASPDDPALTGYWQQRRRRIRPPVDPVTWHLLRRQRGRCPLCRGLLLYASHEPHDERQWEQWHITIRKAVRKHAVSTVMDLGTPDKQAEYHLIHAYCRRRIGDSSRPALLPGTTPAGLA